MRSSKKVLVISQLPPPFHGSTVMTKTFLEAMEALNYEVVLVDRRFSQTVSNVGKFSLQKVFSALGLLGRTLRASTDPSVDVCVFFVTNRSFSFIVDVVISRILTIRKSLPVIAYVHTLGYRDLASRGLVRKRMVRALLGRGTQVVTLGTSLVSDVYPFTTQQPIIIANALGDRVTEVDLDLSRKGGVLFFSNLIREKGIDDFIACARELSISQHGVNFYVAGAESFPGQYDELKDRIREMSLSTRIILLGPLDAEAKWDALTASDILVFPSTYRFEAQPLSVIEAAACALPTIAYDTGALADLIVNGTSGIIVEPSDQYQLLKAIESLLADDDALVGLKRGARTQYETRFSFARYVRDWKAAIEKVSAL